ncbi:Hypothetical protein A7982_00022 [Minicystis rosea]|nr:Hypothetical protein A7982_00022 [Minicystis rosea]
MGRMRPLQRLQRSCRGRRATDPRESRACTPPRACAHARSHTSRGGRRMGGDLGGNRCTGCKCRVPRRSHRGVPLPPPCGGLPSIQPEVHQASDLPPWPPRRRENARYPPRASRRAEEGPRRHEERASSPASTRPSSTPRRGEPDSSASPLGA